MPHHHVPVSLLSHHGPIAILIPIVPFPLSVLVPFLHPSIHPVSSCSQQPECTIPPPPLLSSPCPLVLHFVISPSLSLSIVSLGVGVISVLCCHPPIMVGGLVILPSLLSPIIVPPSRHSPLLSFPPVIVLPFHCPPLLSSSPPIVLPCHHPPLPSFSTPIVLPCRHPPLPLFPPVVVLPPCQILVEHRQSPCKQVLTTVVVGA